MSYKQIRATLENHLKTATGFTLPDIAWQNVQYEPATGKPYLKVNFQPTSRRPAVRGLNPQHRTQGLFTILCYQPENTGPGASETLVDNLVSRFNSTTDITLDGMQVCIEYVEQSTPYSSPPWYITPIQVAWYTYR